MNTIIILKKTPKIEFHFRENGFELCDGQTASNTGFYTYADLVSTDLNNAWFPRVTKWLRAFTWVLNGVPFFPDGESYKKANLVIHVKKTKLGIWLTDTKMTNNAKKLKELLDRKKGL